MNIVDNSKGFISRMDFRAIGKGVNRLKADAELADLGGIAVFRGAEEDDEGALDGVLVHAVAVVSDVDAHIGTWGGMQFGRARGQHHGIELGAVVDDADGQRVARRAALHLRMEWLAVDGATDRAALAAAAQLDNIPTPVSMSVDDPTAAPRPDEGPAAVRVLREALRHSRNDVGTAFQKYQQARYLRTGRVQLTARFYGDIYHATGVQRELRNQLFQGGQESAGFAGLKWMYEGIDPQRLFA